MALSDIRIFRLLVQLALMTLSLSVIGLCIKAMNELAEDRRKVANLFPLGRILARPIVGVGIALVITCIGIIFVAILNSIYILKDRFPQAIRKRCPQSMSTKTMSVFAVILTPINIVQSYLTAGQSSRVTSSVVSEATIEQILEYTGRSLRYKDMVVVVDYTVISWIILLLLIVGIVIESSKFSRPEYGDTTKEQLSA
ncbi:uncharacterized protein PGTG_03363 [Puccinia graminis f. sp. tritici CRL 75-36-700-3]|uniref:Uncharacterized protein n=1 Tax=Puccinia graminis f. sp. tritici (strain CRL 75-36-700-3 / race SCCL) TaxID=418459 RepID=E3JZD2_PUCGT|nr:uncharacterized protein PGTG_03363 [Puccinia graminis f. sp. tritici CRL 75-36-700-3]EFP77407.1 hypothetical protein PGTG_03363 [Puccinia graminis f. sp. tritici CRL 75-36-700-3]